MKNRKRWLAGLAVGGLLLAATFGAGTAAAQQTPQPAPPGPSYGMHMGSGWGHWMMGPAGGGYGMMMGPGFGLTQLQAVAGALGITTDELIAAQRAGKTIAALAEEKGVALDTVVQAVVQAYRQVLDQRVAAGWLTREWADWMLAQMEVRLRAMFTGQWGPGMGWSPPAGARGGMMGPGWWR